ncbi:MAG TPA: hypothetical protein VF961_10320 [Pyrinomonadaceae bacterium]
MDKKYLVVQDFDDCGLPPHNAERLGLSGNDLSPLFLRLSLRKKSLSGTQQKAIGIPHCAAASRNPNNGPVPACSKTNSF